MSQPSSLSLDPRLAGLLCYALGWVSGVIFLVLEQQNRDVRFHAFQSVATFGGLTVLSFGSRFVPFFGVLIAIVVAPLSFILWIVLMVKAYQGERFKLPVVGDWAEQQR